MFRGKALRGALALLVLAGVFAVALPAFAAPGGNFAGFGLRWLGFGGPGSTVEEAAEVLGMTADEVYAAKVEGKTLADLALSKGMTVEELTAKIVAAKTADLDALVAEGKVTEERALAAKANIEANVARSIEQQCTGTCGGTPGTGACGNGRSGQGGLGRGMGRGARAGR